MKHVSDSEIVATAYLNIGVGLYEKGQIEEAIVAFANALSMARCLIEDNDCSISQWSNLYLYGKAFRPQFGRCHIQTFASSDIALFLNPIKVTQGLPVILMPKMLCLISHFNLAICHHRNAIVKDMDIGLLIKSLQLYEMAYSFQIQERIAMTLTPAMIIMSNIGQIHTTMGNHENTQECFRHLLSTLMFLIETGEMDTVSEYDAFFENVMKTVYGQSPAAAAA